MKHSQIKINSIRVFNYIRHLLAHILRCSTPAFFVVLGVYILALALPLQAGWLPTLLNCSFWAGLIVALYFGWRGKKWPRLNETDRALENANELYDRPIQLLTDQIVNESVDKNEIWQSFKDKLTQRLARAKLPALFYLSADKDPYGLRVIPLFIIVILFFAQGYENSLSRFRTMVLPQIAGLTMNTPDAPALVTLEITPPKYTQRSSRSVKGFGRIADVISIAENSTIKVTIKQHWYITALKINGDDVAFKDNAADDSNDFTYEYNAGAFTPDGPPLNITVKTFFLPLFSLNYSLIADTPPSLKIDENFAVLANGTIKFNARIEDDYGTNSLEIFMDLPVDFEGEPPLGTAHHEKRSFLYSAGSHQDIHFMLNLARHPYAGTDTVISFNVVDGAGQLSPTVTIPLTLPERYFNEDIAQRIMALRKFIILDKLAYPNYIYDSLAGFSADLSGLNNDKVAKLALAVARERMLYSPNIDTLYDLIDMLWRVALRLDKGEFLQSQQDLQDTINAMNQILSDPNASQDQKLKAMRDLQNALAAYFQEAQKEAMRQMQDKDVSIMPNAGIPSPNSNALRDFLNQLEDMALNDPDKAKELLNELEKALNNLSNNMQTELPADIKQMMKFMEDMDKVIAEQRALLDKSRTHQDYLSYLEESIRRKEQGAQTDNKSTRGITDLESFFKSLQLPNPDIHDNKGLEESANRPPHDEKNPPSPAMDVILEAGTQRHIQDQLRSITKDMPMVPDELKQADKHMGNSATFLEYERLSKSISEQQKILDALNSKREQMQKAFEQRLQQFAKENNIQFSFDPLGRASGNNGLTRSLRAQEYDLPKTGQRSYIDQILQELRDKASDYEQPKIEREYYKRLLHQW
jgi:uncharacterized protein (TIGR02302 family)